MSAPGAATAAPTGEIDALALAAVPSRSRGTIALLEQNCTSCMLCVRECPDWCIYIDAHSEQVPGDHPGARPRRRDVLDRFVIDFALCMYCGICIEVCPFDALFWSPDYAGMSGVSVGDLRHDRRRLGESMRGVPAPPPGA